MKKYMHTLDGQPAFFDEETKQIYFAARGRHNAVRIVESIAKIHRHERISERTRTKEFGKQGRKFEYGWVSVIL